MIVFEKSRITLGDYMTPRPIDGFLIIYEAPDKGVVVSHLICLQKQTQTDDDGNISETYLREGSLPTGSRTYTEEAFTGRILEKLHADYLAELQAANPDVGFIATMAE